MPRGTDHVAYSRLTDRDRLGDRFTGSAKRKVNICAAIFSHTQAEDVSRHTCTSIRKRRKY